MTKIVSFLSVALMAAVAFTSCIEEVDPSKNTYSVSGFYTITGNATSGYLLHGDFGGKVNPSLASIRSLCGEKGFGDNKRALCYFQYTQDMVSEDKNTLNGAELVAGKYMYVSAPLSPEEAEEAKVTAKDSISRMNELMDVWVANGYLNAAVNGYYANGKTAPTLRMVLNPADISENAAKVTLYYNYHSTSPNGLDYFYYSYPVTNWMGLIPGGGDIQLTVTAAGISEKTIKVERAKLQPIH